MFWIKGIRDGNEVGRRVDSVGGELEIEKQKAAKLISQEIGQFKNSELTIKQINN